MPKFNLVLGGLAILFNISTNADAGSGSVSTEQAVAIDQAMAPPQFNATSVIIKFPKIAEEELPQLSESLPAPQYTAKYTPIENDPNGQTKVEVVDAEGMTAMDETGRMAEAVIPGGVELKTVESDEQAAANKGNWVLVILKDVIQNTSIGVGMTQVQHYETSIWWQQGLPYTMKLISPSGDIQFNIKAKSIGFLSKIKNKIVSNIVNRTSLNIGYFYYGSFSSDAQATMSGFDDPKTHPIYQWTGTGNAQGIFITIQEELPANFYVAAGVIKYRNTWKMVVHKANCAGTKFSCPNFGPETVYDADGAMLGGRITIGRHIGSHGAVEFNVDSDSDNNWSPNGFPPIWHNQAYTIEYRQRL